MIRTVVVAGTVSAQGILVRELGNGQAIVDIGGGQLREGTLIQRARA